jgi:mono/diheme cytochrome c family protein
MARLFKTAWVLVTTAAMLAFVLTGFTLYSIDSNIDDGGTVPAPAKAPIVRLETISNTKAAAGQKVFNANCKSCHRLDQKLIGPALRGAFTRLDSLWITKWITNSSKMIADEDPAAVEVFLEYNKVAMTNFTSMKKEDMDALLAYLKYVDAEEISVP